MMEALVKGDDIHAITASEMFNLPVDEIIQMDKEKKMAPIGFGNHTHRYWGKQSGLAFDYGRGHTAFALAMEIPESDGLSLKEGYFRAFPEIKSG